MNGTSRLIGVSWEGAHAPLTPADVEITGFATADDDVVVAFQSATTFGDVGILRDGELTALTDFSARGARRRNRASDGTGGRPDATGIRSTAGSRSRTVMGRTRRCS